MTMNFFILLLVINLGLLATDVVLLNELKIMCENDQRARFAAIDSDAEAAEVGWQMVEATDRENLPRLKGIVEQFGWPGSQLVGEEGADHMWLLVQHCDQDIDFQKLCLELLRVAVGKEDVPKKHLAYLTDRVLVNMGEAQLYGTQMQIIDGCPIPQPIEQPVNLDSRREEMGLGTFEAYLDLFKEIYHLK